MPPEGFDQERSALPMTSLPSKVVSENLPLSAEDFQYSLSRFPGTSRYSRHRRERSDTTSGPNSHKRHAAQSEVGVETVTVRTTKKRNNPLSPTTNEAPWTIHNSTGKYIATNQVARAYASKAAQTNSAKHSNCGSRDHMTVDVGEAFIKYERSGRGIIEDDIYGIVTSESEAPSQETSSRALSTDTSIEDAQTNDRHNNRQTVNIKGTRGSADTHLTFDTLSRADDFQLLRRSSTNAIPVNVVNEGNDPVLSADRGYLRVQNSLLGLSHVAEPSCDLPMFVSQSSSRCEIADDLDDIDKELLNIGQIKTKSSQLKNIPTRVSRKRTHENAELQTSEYSQNGNTAQRRNHDDVQMPFSKKLKRPKRCLPVDELVLVPERVLSKGILFPEEDTDSIYDSQISKLKNYHTSTSPGSKRNSKARHMGDASLENANCMIDLTKFKMPKVRNTLHPKTNNWKSRDSQMFDSFEGKERLPTGRITKSKRGTTNNGINLRRLSARMGQLPLVSDRTFNYDTKVDYSDLNKTSTNLASDEDRGMDMDMELDTRLSTDSAHKIIHPKKLKECFESDKADQNLLIRSTEAKNNNNSSPPSTMQGGSFSKGTNVRPLNRKVSFNENVSVQHRTLHIQSLVPEESDEDESQEVESDEDDSDEDMSSRLDEQAECLSCGEEGDTEDSTDPETPASDSALEDEDTVIEGEYQGSYIHHNSQALEEPMPMAEDAMPIQTMSQRLRAQAPLVSQYIAAQLEKDDEADDEADLYDDIICCQGSSDEEDDYEILDVDTRLTIETLAPPLELGLRRGEVVETIQDTKPRKSAKKSLMNQDWGSASEIDEKDREFEGNATNGDDSDSNGAVYHNNAPTRDLDFALEVRAMAQLFSNSQISPQQEPSEPQELLEPITQDFVWDSINGPLDEEHIELRLKPNSVLKSSSEVIIPDSQADDDWSSSDREPRQRTTLGVLDSSRTTVKSPHPVLKADQKPSDEFNRSTSFHLTRNSLVGPQKEATMFGIKVLLDTAPALGTIKGSVTISKQAVQEAVELKLKDSPQGNAEKASAFSTRRPVRNQVPALLRSNRTGFK